MIDAALVSVLLSIEEKEFSLFTLMRVALEVSGYIGMDGL